MTIKKAAVIGAGVMGAGIAAQLANAGIEVELLDRVDPKNPEDRNAVAAGAIERMHKTKPAPLMHKRNAKKIRPGNTEDNLDRLADCDIVIEAVFEDPKVKYDIFQKIDAHRKPGSIVASNTSTIPLQNLTEGQSEQFKKDFVITHFFNPPRYMPLLELVTSEHNSPETVAAVTRFMDEKMGKGVVHCKDTPGFIANRIGTFWLQCAVNEAIDRKLTVEEADALIGKPMGIPKTGVFGLIDLVGLDLMPHISKSLISKLPADDGYVLTNKAHPVIDDMIKNGFTGRKGKGGFYRRDENKNDFAVDLQTGDVRPKKRVKLKAAENARSAPLWKKPFTKHNSLRALFDTKDKHGDYAWAVFKQTVSYAAEHVHGISGNITDVDQAMKLGYNWKQGPFEMLDKLGVDYFIQRVKAEGGKVPAFIEQAAGKKFYKAIDGKLNFLNEKGEYEQIKRPEGVLLLSDIKRASKPVADNTKAIPGVGKIGAALWDAGDGVLCLEFTSTMNTLDPRTMKMIHKACDIIEQGKKTGKDGQKFKALVIHNEGENFSLGANLGLALLAAKSKQTWMIERLVRSGQEAYKRLKYASFPVVSAPSGMALGGGCEILLHSHHVQAHAETYPGLVEVGVGLLPAWGGCAELLTRAKQDKRLPNGPMPAVAKVFETISTAKVGTSAFEAKDLMYLRASDGVTMNKNRLLADAKAKALELAKDFKPEVPFDMQLPGPAGSAAFNMAVDGFFLRGAVTPYDVVVSDKVGKVLSGGDAAGPGVVITQDYIRELERKHFMELVNDPRTVKRIAMTIAGKKRPDVEKVENAALPQKAAELRVDADRPGFFARVFRVKSIKACFAKVCGKKPCNDNKAQPGGLARDTRAKINWPRLGG